MGILITCCPCGRLSTIAKKDHNDFYSIRCPACGQATTKHKDPDKAVTEWESLCEKRLEDE